MTLVADQPATDSAAQPAASVPRVEFRTRPADYKHWRQAVDEAYPVLREWRAQGVVGAIGAGMNQWQLLHRFVTETDIDVVMLAGRYTLLDRSAEQRLLPVCAAAGVRVLAAGVFNGGMLATDEPGDLEMASRLAQALARLF